MARVAGRPLRNESVARRAAREGSAVAGLTGRPLLDMKLVVEAQRDLLGWEDDLAWTGVRARCAGRQERVGYGLAPRHGSDCSRVLFGGLSLGSRWGSPPVAGRSGGSSPCVALNRSSAGGRGESYDGRRRRCRSVGRDRRGRRRRLRTRGRGVGECQGDRRDDGEDERPEAEAESLLPPHGITATLTVSIVRKRCPTRRFMSCCHSNTVWHLGANR